MLNLTLRLQTLHTHLSFKLWIHLLTMELSLFGNYPQTPNKITKNQGENKKMSLMSSFTKLQIC